MSSTQEESQQLMPLLPDPKKEKPGIDKALLCFGIVNFILNAAVSVIAPFYPPLAHDEAGVSIKVIGYIFSLNPVGAFTFSLVFGKYMSLWGRKRCMIIGLIVHSLVIVAFGLLYYITPYYGLFITVSCLTRFVQGASRAAYSSISFAYVPLLWPDSVQKKISILESMTGLGLMCGPFLGAALDKIFGYQMIFYSMGALFLLSVIPTYLLIPQDEPHDETKKQIDTKPVIKSRQIWSLGMLLTMMSAGTTFINPVFTIHMKSYSIGEDTASLMLGWLTISYILFINVVPLICKVVDKKVVLTFGLMFSAFGDLIIAPLGFFPNEWYMAFIGLPLIGVANALCVLPAIPQYIDYLTIAYKNDPAMKSGISDLASGLFISFYSLGTCVGPSLGGTVYDAFNDDESVQSELYSFQRASFVLAGVQFATGILFLFAGDVLKSKNKRQENISVRDSISDLGQSLQPEPYPDEVFNSLDNDDALTIEDNKQVGAIIQDKYKNNDL